MSNKHLVIPLHLGVKGHFKLEAVKRDGSRRLLADWFNNLITNGGLDRLGTDFVGSHCHVGSGSAVPANTDSQLQTFVAATNGVQSTVFGYDAGPPFLASLTRTWRFAEGVAEGNLSEVGVGWGGTSTGPLFSRELIRDGVGNATTITVLADEFLDVTYQLQVIPPQSDVVGNVTDSGPAGTVHGYTMRASQLNSSGSWLVTSRPFVLSPIFISSTGGFHRAYTGLIGSTTESPAGSFGNSTGQALSAYVGASLERLWTITWGLDTANFNIKSLDTGFGLGKLQVELDPVVAKTNTDTLTVGFKVSWARAA